MSLNYRESQLWKNTLGTLDGSNQEQIDLLKTEFEKIHKNVSCLASNISNQFPEYTLHDISHADALWGLADIILEGTEIKLNPAEGFVLGCAFLFHDLGMSLAVYKNRDKLEESVYWKDAYASYLKKGIPTAEAKKKADVETLRATHSHNAKGLPLLSFNNGKGDIFVIENADLRNGFGETIGKLAYSHGVSADELGSIFPSKELGALSELVPNWTVDTIKLAGILRIADAIHICSDRTPSILMASKRLSKISELHWTFQSKLCTPMAEHGRLKYTSKRSFAANERESWWLCYDVLKMINEELLAVDALFSNSNILPLSVFCVKGIENPKSLSDFIQTEGWTPIECRMQVSNVSGLINSLGGTALYGNEPIIPLRELIQNASDAIQARCRLGEMSESEGRIDIRFGSDEEGDFIEVEDNGIGMSQKVLTGPLIDFGLSFWGSELMRQDLSGLESTNFHSIGHFGIGFFSVFMWGDRVSVTTRRFDKGKDGTNILEFYSGSNSRPLLRKANAAEMMNRAGTKVKIWVSNLDLIKQGIVKHKWCTTEKTCVNFYTENFENITLENQIFNLCCGLNVDVYLNGCKILEANEWKTISNVDFVKKYCKKCHWLREKLDVEEYAPMVAERVSLLMDGKGNCVGRGILDHFLKGSLVAGGIKVCNTYGFAGIMFGTSSVASRNSGLPIISEKDFAKWLAKQVDLLNADKTWEIEDPGFEVAMYIREFDMDTKEISIAYNQNKKLNSKDVAEIIRQKKMREIIIVDVDDLHHFSREMKPERMYFDENVFFCQFGERSVVSCGDNEEFPAKDSFDGCFSLINAAFSSCWGQNNVEMVRSDRNKKIERSIGRYGRRKINAVCDVILKVK